MKDIDLKALIKKIVNDIKYDRKLYKLTAM